MKSYSIRFAWALFLWAIIYKFSILAGHEIELFGAVWWFLVFVNVIGSSILTGITYAVLDLKR